MRQERPTAFAQWWEDYLAGDYELASYDEDHCCCCSGKCREDWLLEEARNRRFKTAYGWYTLRRDEFRG